MRIQQTLQLSHLGTFPDIISFFTIFPSRFSPQPIQEAVWKLPWASTSRSSLIPATVNRIIVLAMCTIMICTFKPKLNYEGWFRAPPPGNILWQVPFLSPRPNQYFMIPPPLPQLMLKNTILKSVSLYTVILIRCGFVKFFWTAQNDALILKIFYFLFCLMNINI